MFRSSWYSLFYQFAGEDEIFYATLCSTLLLALLSTAISKELRLFLALCSMERSVLLYTSQLY